VDPRVYFLPLPDAKLCAMFRESVISASGDTGYVPTCIHLIAAYTAYFPQYAHQIVSSVCRNILNLHISAYTITLLNNSVHFL